jgi:hypothetical protein
MKYHDEGPYGEAAVKAVNLLVRKKVAIPAEAWRQAVSGKGIRRPGQKSASARGAFLGLCEEGYVRGVPSGDYSGAARHKAYAVKAAQFLTNGHQPDKGALWASVVNRLRRDYERSSQHEGVAEFSESWLTKYVELVRKDARMQNRKTSPKFWDSPDEGRLDVVLALWRRNRIHKKFISPPKPYLARKAV